MPVWISLLRGINVGGNKKIKMAELRDLYASWSFDDVQSLLQSGNVVFKSDETDPDAIGETIYQGIQAHYGFESKIIIRSVDALEKVVFGHLFTPAQLEDPQKLLIAFLSDALDEEALATLKEAYSGPEIIQQQGRELYIYYPDGMGRSKLDNNFIERKLNVTSTGRNWNTATKLLALAQSL